MLCAKCGLDKIHHYCHCLQQGSSVPTAILFSTLASSKRHHNFPQTFSRHPLDRKYRVSSNLWCIPSLVSKGASVLRSLGHFTCFYTKMELENINAMKPTYLSVSRWCSSTSVGITFLPLHQLFVHGTFFCIRSQKSVAQLSIHSPSVSASRINSYFLEK